MNRHIVIVRNFHPNEQVAFEMADRVYQELLKRGVDATLVDLEPYRKRFYGFGHDWADLLHDSSYDYFLALQDVRSQFFNCAIFDIHDTPMELYIEFNNPLEPSFQDSTHDYWDVEMPAVYVPQPDTRILAYGVHESLRMEGYFTTVSDVALSKDAGFCTDEWVITIADGMVKLASDEV